MAFQKQKVLNLQEELTLNVFIHKLLYLYALVRASVSMCARRG